MTDQQALTEFAQTRSAVAFNDLVLRYVDLVYSTARRIARDEHLAEDVTQAVFIVLARRAHSINPKYLAGWLVNTSRLASRDAIRTRKRQSRRDAEAAQMRSEIQLNEEPTAEQITPLLDDALARLSQADRSAVVLRFLQGRSFSEVGTALGTAEDAARKRVERAIERLRKHFFDQGIAPSIGGLAVILALHQAKAAPVSLAMRVSTTVISGSTGAAVSIANAVLRALFRVKMTIACLIAIAVIGAGGSVIADRWIWYSPTAFQPASSPVALVPSAPPLASSAADEIQPNDRLRVTVVDLEGLHVGTTFWRRVDSSGFISLPWVGQIQVSRKQPPDAEAAISKAFFNAHVIQHAQVAVEFDERGAGISIKCGPFEPGDHLLLHVANIPGLGFVTTQLYVVQANGMIMPPLLKNVYLQGLTETQVEALLVQEYASAHLLDSAEVAIERISASEAAADPSWPSVTSPTSAPAGDSTQSPGEEEICPNDRLRVTICNLTELHTALTLWRRVEPSGQIDLPFVGQVRVGGEVPLEAEKKINRAYYDAHVLKNARATVRFDETGASISITSAPFQPGDRILMYVGGSTALKMQGDLLRSTADRDGTVPLPGLGAVKTAGSTPLEIGGGLLYAIVDRDGTITPRGLGAVKIAGLTEFEAENALAKAYRSAHLMADGDYILVERISAKEAIAHGLRR